MATHVWTEREDTIIRQMRLEAEPPFAWGTIALRLGFVSHQAIIDRAKALNFPESAFDKLTTLRDEEPRPQHVERMPLPPGHPISWFAISADPWPG